MKICVRVCQYIFHLLLCLGLCKVVLNVESPGLWTYLQASSHNGVSGQDELCALRQDMMSSPVPPGNTPSCSTATESDPRLPPITEITVKKVKNSLGISITGGKVSGLWPFLQQFPRNILLIKLYFLK